MTTTPAPLDLDQIRACLNQHHHSVDHLHMTATRLLDELAKTRADLATTREVAHANRRIAKGHAEELAKTRAELDDADAALRRLGDKANDLVQQLRAADVARQRIAEAHHKHVDAHGGTYGECNECGNTWPCPTYVWATTNRDPLATWDPADDDPAQPLADASPATTAEPAAPHCGLCGSEDCPGKPGEGCMPGPFETYEPSSSVGGTTTSGEEKAHG